MKDLKVLKKIGFMDIEYDIESNKINKCLHCGEKINIENDSGWEVFTKDGYTTQSICKDCDNKLMDIDKFEDELN